MRRTLPGITYLGERIALLPNNTRPPNDRIRLAVLAPSPLRGRPRERGNADRRRQRDPESGWPGDPDGQPAPPVLDASAVFLRSRGRWAAPPHAVAGREPDRLPRY